MPMIKYTDNYANSIIGYRKVLINLNRVDGNFGVVNIYVLEIQMLHNMFRIIIELK